MGALTDEDHSLLYVQFLVNPVPAPQYREPRWLSVGLATAHPRCWVASLCPCMHAGTRHVQTGSSLHNCTYIVAYSKRKSPKDRALLEPLERPPYHQRRFGTSLGHLKHWGSRVWAAAAPPGPRRYASVIFAFKLDPLVSDLRSQSQKSEDVYLPSRSPNPPSPPPPPPGCPDHDPGSTP
eukprot:COSAG06_NODE_237_length_19433_cov_92.613961_8_plen_180_part_00